MRYLAILSSVITLCGTAPLANASDDLEAYLQNRIDENPQHSDNWRLLGDFYHRQHRDAEATEAFKKSLEFDPDNAATHFNWGQLLESQGDSNAARDHFQRVYQVAPESEYAERLRKMGYLESIETVNRSPYETALYEIQNTDEILQAGYEIQTFDASDDFKRRVRELETDLSLPDKKFRLFLETGAVWNSNVTLTPISRQLIDADAASFQVVFNPEVEWKAWDSEGRRGGPLMRGFFTKNEEHLSQFDLASFQPGIFFEQDLSFEEWTHVARLEYVYAVDLLDGDRFGDRHSATASITSILPNLDAVYTYGTFSFSQFDTPVIDAETNSLNGPAYLVGCSRFFNTESDFLPLWSLGADLEYVDAEGDDFRYFGGKLHADATCHLTDQLDWIPSGNVGFRSYPDFTNTPARDELTYRISSRLRYHCSESWTIALVVNYDRFASDNENFDADRIESGIVTTFQR